jgi:rubrerythrin
MAELHLYRCEKCGWEIESPNDGADFLMDGLLAYYVCNDCKHVFGKSYALGTVFEGTEQCPICKGHNTKEWKPSDGCPKCGGKMIKQGLSCLMD